MHIRLTHPKLYKWIISNIKAFFLGGAISFVVTASATVILHSRQVRYKNDKSVEQAINELYEKAEQIEQEKINKIGCDGCTKLEYLESTGTQYIDTAIIPNQNTSLSIDYKPKSYDSFSGNKFICGTRDGDISMFHLFFKQNYNTISITYGSYRENEKSFDVATGRHKIKTMKNLVYLDNELVINFSNLEFNLSKSILVFTSRAFSGGVPDSRTASFKLYDFKIYDNDTLVRDYIPVLDKNNRPCLFDKVSKACFYNQGTGEFLYG